MCESDKVKLYVTVEAKMTMYVFDELKKRIEDARNLLKKIQIPPDSDTIYAKQILGFDDWNLLADVITRCGCLVGNDEDYNEEENTL